MQPPVNPAKWISPRHEQFEPAHEMAALRRRPGQLECAERGGGFLEASGAFQQVGSCGVPRGVALEQGFRRADLFQIASPSFGPSDRPTATARFSATTGVGRNSARRALSAAISLQRTSSARRLRACSAEIEAWSRYRSDRRISSARLRMPRPPRIASQRHRERS